MTSETELRQTFNAIKAAELACDVETLEKLIADDYFGFGPTGEPQTRESIMEAYRPGGVKLEVNKAQELDVRVLGEVGLITGRGHISGSWGNITFAHELRFMDIYVWRDARWQLLATQVTEMAASDS